MTVRTDLDNAFSILDAGITAHVTALKSARDTAAAAQAVANDDTYLQSLTVKVLAFADTLNSSNPPVIVAPVVVAPAPVVVAPVLTPAVAVAAQVAQVLPVAPVAAPAVAPVVAAPIVVAPVTVAAVPAPAPVAVPSVMQTMEAAVKAMTASLTK